MLNYWVKHKEIDLYVEREIDTAIFDNDDLMLIVATVEGVEGVEGLNGEGVEVAGSESGESLGGEGVEVVGSEGGEVEGVDGLDASIEGLKENGDDDEELQEARKKVRELEGKTSGKTKETILDETESESSGEQFEDEVPEEAEGDGLDNRVDREEEGNETEYFDSDDQRSILGLDDDDNTDTCRRRSRFPTYNPNSAGAHFFIGMVSNSNPQFVSTQCVVEGNFR
ncbi:hypothetical protein GOBAR_DD23521 [Gossypium barbadense]|nr:hypothetical protein GOBAR_DD23521 [Gossypium barbadense]